MKPFLRLNKVPPGEGLSAPQKWAKPTCRESVPCALQQIAVIACCFRGPSPNVLSWSSMAISAQNGGTAQAQALPSRGPALAGYLAWVWPMVACAWIMSGHIWGEHHGIPRTAAFPVASWKPVFSKPLGCSEMSSRCRLTRGRDVKGVLFSSPVSANCLCFVMYLL